MKDELDEYEYFIYNDELLKFDRKESVTKKSIEIALVDYGHTDGYDNRFNFDLRKNFHDEKTFISFMNSVDFALNFELIYFCYIKDRNGVLVPVENLRCSLDFDSEKQLLENVSVKFNLDSDKYSENRFTYFTEGEDESERVLTMSNKRRYPISKNLVSEEIKFIIKDILHRLVYKYDTKIFIFRPREGIFYIERLYYIIDKITDEKEIKKRIIKENFE